MVATELGRRKFHLGVGLRQRDAGLEQCSGLKGVVLTFADGIKLKWEPDIGFGIGEEFFSEDADNGVRLIAKSERLAYGAGIAAELALPQSVAQHHDLAAVRCVLLRSEGAAQNDRSAEDAKVALGHMSAMDLLRPVSGDVEARAGPIVSGYVQIGRASCRERV